MKRLLLVLPILFALVLTTHYVYAQAPLAMTPALSPTPTPQIDYPLPYPGILPDNPLYQLKTLRDRIVSFFIADPLRKADFDLLQADKRVNAGYFLFLQRHNKEALIALTISKGDNYFSLGLGKAQEAIKQGEDANDLLRRMHDAAFTYESLLTKMISQSNGSLQTNLQSEEKRVQEFEKQVASLRK